jgi:hypothetical protein
MAEFNVLPWQNENSLTSYPLVYPLDYDGFIVGASFIQFDYFIPVLGTIFVGSGSVEVTITFDCGEVTQSYSETEYHAGVREIRFMDGEDRYLGCLTVGEQANFLWDNFRGQKLVKNIPFLPSVVWSIPSKDAVYALDSIYGDVVFSIDLSETTSFTNPQSFNYQNNFIPGISFENTAGGETIFYNFNSVNNALIFNAVANHAIPVGDFSVHALKRINLVPPVDNNLYLASNDLIKFSSINNQKLQISLAGKSVSGASIVPTLAS